MISLKPLDIEFMKRLDSRVNIVPVIAKADTLTANEVKALKRKVREYTTISISLLDDCAYIETWYYLNVNNCRFWTILVPTISKFIPFQRLIVMKMKSLKEKIIS